jgi:endoribonuclease LACTB2
MSRSPRRAAALIVRRGDGAVLCGVRTDKARSWPGTLAFPGGALDDEDQRLPLWSRPAGHTASGGHDPEGVARAGVLREALEEVGLVRLARPDGEAPAAAELAEVLAALRQGAGLLAALALRRLVLDDRGLQLAQTWRTAESSFLVDQFLWDAPTLTEQALAPPLHAELDQIGFRQPAAVLAGWRMGEVFLLPPIRRTVTVLVDMHKQPAPTLLAALGAPIAEGERCRRDLIAGVAVFQGRTPTLPPATHTNTSLLGDEHVFLVDPATPYQNEQARFDAHLAALLLPGGRVAGIIATHHHVDHVGDIARLRALHGCPVYAHPETARRVDFPVDVLLAEGDVLHVEGRVPRRFEVLFTPGHAQGHVCLWEPDARLLIAGDMVAGVGSILIDPADGHMGTYLAQLERLAALRPRALIPAHGPLLVDGEARLRAQIAHREARARAVVAAVRAGQNSVETLVPAVYGPDTPRAMWPLAERSLLAILAHQQEEGVLVSAGAGRWQVA